MCKSARRYLCNGNLRYKLCIHCKSVCHSTSDFRHEYDRKKKLINNIILKLNN